MGAGVGAAEELRKERGLQDVLTRGGEQGVGTEVDDDPVLLSRLEAHLAEEHRLIRVPRYGKFLRVIETDVRRRSDVEIQIEESVVRHFESQGIRAGVGDHRLDLDRIAEEIDLLVEKPDAELLGVLHVPGPGHTAVGRRPEGICHGQENEGSSDCLSHEAYSLP